MTALRKGDEGRPRDLMVEIGRRMYERRFVAGTDGNMSIRLGDSRVLTTPTGVAKGFLTSGDLVVTDLEGNVESGGRPSSELAAHLAVYNVRPDVQAVVHAHPKAAVALSLAGCSLVSTFVPETVFTLGVIADAGYETPGSPDLARKIGDILSHHDAVIMERHGTITLGSELDQAYLRLESLEHTAEIVYMARTIGRVEPLPDGEVQHLFDLAVSPGADGGVRAEHSSVVSAGSSPPFEHQQAIRRVSMLVNELQERVSDLEAASSSDDIQPPCRPGTIQRHGDPVA